VGKIKCLTRPVKQFAHGGCGERCSVGGGEHLVYRGLVVLVGNCEGLPCIVWELMGWDGGVRVELVDEGIPP